MKDKAYVHLVLLLVMSEVAMSQSVQILTLPQRFRDSTTASYREMEYLKYRDTIKAHLTRTISGDQFSLFLTVRGLRHETTSDTNIVAGLKAMNKSNDTAMAFIGAYADGKIQAKIRGENPAVTVDSGQTQVLNTLLVGPGSSIILPPLNFGVTNIVAGYGILIDPVDGLGEVTITADTATLAGVWLRKADSTLYVTKVLWADSLNKLVRLRDTNSVFYSYARVRDSLAKHVKVRDTNSVYYSYARIRDSLATRLQIRDSSAGYTTWPRFRDSLAVARGRYVWKSDSAVVYASWPQLRDSLAAERARSWFRADTASSPGLPTINRMLDSLSDVRTSMNNIAGSMTKQKIIDTLNSAVAPLVGGITSQWRWVNTSNDFFGDTASFTVGNFFSTTEPLRVGYNTSNYLKFTLASAGTTTLTAVGTNPSIFLAPAGTGYVATAANLALGGTATTPAANLHIISTSGGANSPIIAIREGANPTYGFTWKQDDVTSGDMTLDRLNAGSSTLMLTFTRNTGVVNFAVRPTVGTPGVVIFSDSSATPGFPTTNRVLDSLAKVIKVRDSSGTTASYVTWPRERDSLAARLQVRDSSAGYATFPRFRDSLANVIKKRDSTGTTATYMTWPRTRDSLAAIRTSLNSPRPMTKQQVIDTLNAASPDTIKLSREIKYTNSTTIPSLQLGATAFQSYADNNFFIGNNTYYSGAFKRIVDGNVGVFQWNSGILYLRGALWGATGSTASLTNYGVIDTAGNWGVGTTTPSARLHSLSTTEQLRLGYDASNYASFTVGSGGNLTMTQIGAGVTFNGTSNFGLSFATPTANNAYLRFGSNGIYKALCGYSTAVGGFSFDHKEAGGSLAGGTLFLVEGNVGVGTYPPSAKLHVLSTTEQLRLGYDASNYVKLTVGATGSMTIGGAGNAGGKILQDSSAYGDVYIEEDTKSDSITVSSSVTYYTIGAVQPPNGYKLTSGGVLKNITVQDSSMTVVPTGVYRYSYSGDGRVLNMASGNSLHAHLFVNDVLEVKGGSDSQVSATNTYFHFSNSGLINVTAANTIFKVKVNSPDDASGTIIFHHFNLTLTRIE